MQQNQKVFLVVLDGWGKGKNPQADAIAHARTPFMDSLYARYPHTELITFGEAVGLPSGQMGNSEVGHLNIGAGRIVNQELQRIFLAIQDGSLQHHPVLQQTFQYCIANHKPLHLMGLLSDGGVHSHIDHVQAIVRYAAKAGVQDILIHAFTDGRDTDPRSAVAFVKQLESGLPSVARVVSVCGRYYAMDRDKRWERVKKAWSLLVEGKGKSFATTVEAIEASYASGITDEFIEPAVIGAGRTMQSNDAVLCFNFRTDRCREITQVLTQKAFPELEMHPLSLHYVTLTRYDEQFSGVHVIFEQENLTDTLGQVLSEQGKTQLRAAETEKYPHVTFFFSGGREEVFPGEERILIPSPKVSTYDLQPEMSAVPLQEAVSSYVRQHQPDFVCLNFANADMVGHTGVFQAAVKACETVDSCLQKLVTEGLQLGYVFFITADHGNSDYMINPDGSPNTAHSTNPVPFIVVSASVAHGLRAGKLGDIAPTVLKTMGIAIPEAMTGQPLF
jgi:2,3-bisphosphoglycerate-independent phosphoglycerate mutase